MTIVTCDNAMCKFNSAIYPLKVGECQNAEINLVYKCTDDEETEYLDCQQFQYRKLREYRKV
jgi:hypothetical protein